MLRTHSALHRFFSIGACLVSLGASGVAVAKPRGKAIAPAPAPEAAAVAAPSAQPEAAPDPAPAESVQAAAEGGAAPLAADAPVDAAQKGSAEGSPGQTPQDEAQLATLRAQAAELIDELAQARAKATLLGKTLFKTQLRLRIQNLAAPDPRLTKLVLKLDGAPVFVGDGAALSGDAARQVFEGFVAPGRHVLTAELTQQSRQDESFGYSMHDSYNFKAQKDKVSELTLIVDDDSDMASEYPDDGDGEYDVRLKLRVRTKERGEE
jgi:hypothetical protein